MPSSQLWTSDYASCAPSLSSASSTHSHLWHRRSTSRRHGGRGRSRHGSRSTLRSSSRRRHRDRSARHSRVYYRFCLSVTDYQLPVITLRSVPAATLPVLVPLLEVRNVVIVAGLAVRVRATTHLVPLVTRRGRRDWPLTSDSATTYAPPRTLRPIRCWWQPHLAKITTRGF